MLNVTRALRSDRLMNALAGLTMTEFKSLLLASVRPDSKPENKSGPQRQRALAGGRKHTLSTPQHKFFFSLFYLI